LGAVCQGGAVGRSKLLPKIPEKGYIRMIELRESQKEYALHLKETERILKEKNAEFYEKLGHLTNLFGDVTEAMVAPKICDKFKGLCVK